jgi:hypothetical protein
MIARKRASCTRTPIVSRAHEENGQQLHDPVGGNLTVHRAFPGFELKLSLSFVYSTESLHARRPEQQLLP